MHADELRLNSLLSTRDHLEAFGPSSAHGREWKRDRESGHLREKSQIVLIYCKGRQWAPDPTEHQS